MSRPEPVQILLCFLPHDCTLVADHEGAAGQVGQAEGAVPAGGAAGWPGAVSSLKVDVQELLRIRGALPVGQTGGSRRRPPARDFATHCAM